MMETITLRESVTEAPIKVGKRWKVVAARPGQGSSGYYSAEVLKEYGPAALHPGAQAFINHDDSRNPKDMIGTYPDGGYWDEDEQALLAELEVFSHYEKFVEEVGPHCGVSIYMGGKKDRDGNVLSITPKRSNGVDLVSQPGLLGSGLAEKLYESAQAQSSQEPGADSVQDDNRKVQDMDIEARLDKLTASVDALVADRASAKAAEAQAAEATVNQEAIETAVQEALAVYAERLDAIEDADLTQFQRDSLREEAQKGVDVLPLIESATKTTAAIKDALLKESEAAGKPGFIHTGGESTFTSAAWGTK